MSGYNIEWQLDTDERIWLNSKYTLSKSNPVPLVVLLRIRNEELILDDTLEHLSQFADYICAYDDASTDDTRSILKRHDKVVMIIQNNKWKSGIENRLLSETRHRGILLQEARRYLNFNWCMCCDADERYFGDIRGFVTSSSHDKPDGIRIQLFDAYMTENDSKPYVRGDKLSNFRHFFGPECRHILMLWKNKHQVKYVGLDAREPTVSGTVSSDFYCQHYGKSLSHEHWESTCDYYIEHFPWIPYGKKWSERKGCAVHVRSDFGRPLYPWGPDLIKNSVTNF